MGVREGRKIGIERRREREKERKMVRESSSHLFSSFR